MRRPDFEGSRKHPVRPQTYWRPPLRPRTEKPDVSNALVPFAIVGLMAFVAITLIVGVILTGPDTHANLWNEARAGYERTDVIYVSPTTGSIPVSSPGTGEVSFSREVLPVLQAKCASCHGLGIAIKGISVTSYEDLIDAEAHEPLVVPGELDESPLLIPLRSTESPMPPTGPLPEEQIQTIEDWIREGAKNN